ncbi:hypothetical protein LX32DRAFT_723663 [Colletotrichum zoysiae]|uniref:Protein kinase domain-containing protein n=1 Tax=Colletotrichum zoysiae TaxID=1216348 RepID=A0AAD9M5K1_9PEZI|nr:hypothetical protein LX32DRAFT_723663 [Colletotrichum zoysiae]
MSLSEDAAIFQDHKQLYGPSKLIRKRLRLRPHKPLPPHGSNLYPFPPGVTGKDLMLSEEQKNQSITRLVFDPENQPKSGESFQHDESFEMEVEILELIGGTPGTGYKPGPQKLVCQVLEAPSASPWDKEHKRPAKGQYLFLKVYDALMWHKVVDVTKRLLKVTFQADSAFSDEFGAYHFLYKRNLTGFNRDQFERTDFSPIAPQFYGGWIAQVATVNEEFKDKYRQVAVLALENVNGVRMQELFSRSGPDKVVELIARDKKPASFEADLDERLEIMAQLMHGTVTEEKAGLDHCNLHPRNVIITMETKGAKPRAVLVGYGNAIIDELRQEPSRTWEYFPKPPHPILRFGWPRLDRFAGWFPLEWRGPDDYPDRCPLTLKWQVERFGGLVDNPDYTVFADPAPVETTPDEELP